MPTFLSTTATMPMPTIAPSNQGSHQLALRRMSVKVLLGATNVSTTRSTSDRGWFSDGRVAVAELMGAPSSRTFPGRMMRRDCTTTDADYQPWTGAMAEQTLAPGCTDSNPAFRLECMHVHA